MIHAFAIDPELAATWGRRDEFRYVQDKFGVGTARAMLELPAFTAWKSAVHASAVSLALGDLDMKRIEELFRLLGEGRCRRRDSIYDTVVSWLENAEREHTRRTFSAILAAANPRGHTAVIVGTQLGHAADPRWDAPSAVTSVRTGEALAKALHGVLVNSRVLHLVDPHFGAENARHRKVLEALLLELVESHGAPDLVQVHCSDKATLAFFQTSASEMAARLPRGITVSFRRWRERDGGEKLHNRFVLTDLGGVTLGVGLDSGRPGQTDDLLILPRPQFELRWQQYVANNGAFDLADEPAPVVGTRIGRR